jgi:hypothetical protein
MELEEIEFGNHDSPGSESGLMAGFLNTVMNLWIPLR